MAPTLYDKEPNPGDLIEINRGTYQHWAVYIGDGYIVHLAPPSEVTDASYNSVMSVLADRAVVKKEKLWDLVRTDKWNINNSLDEKYKPLPVDIIVNEAKAQVGREVQYCVFTGNCEHFVNELRYGKAESRQVQKAGEVFVAASLAGAVGLGLAAVVGAVLWGTKKDKKQTQ